MNSYVHVVSIFHYATRRTFNYYYRIKNFLHFYIKIFGNFEINYIVDVNLSFTDKTRSQLSKLHELYENKFNLNSCFTKHLTGDAVRAVSRCQSLTLSELCNPGENNLRNNDFENSSIASEPAYIVVDQQLFKIH